MLRRETILGETLCRSITNLEKHLHRNGTYVIKFFLHLFQGRTTPSLPSNVSKTRNATSKFSGDDLKERAYWKKYMHAYEACLGATSTGHAPWYVVPADDKLNARLIISRIVLERFKDMKLSYPKPDAKRLKELQSFRKQLTK